MRSLRPFVLSAALLVGLAGCGSSSHNPAAAAGVGSRYGAGPGAASGAGPGPLIIQNFSFSPKPLLAKAGDTITITNRDATDHTVTDSGGAFDTGHIAPGTSKTITVSKAGTYNFHCNIHQTMKGVIQVSA